MSLLPFTFVSLLHSPEDYYERWSIGSLIRLSRLAAIGITLFLPALYIAILSFHPGMIPFKLVFSIVASREGVPFPAVIEALLMEVTLELREAGIRLPKPIGQTIGIVGGLVIEVAVQAGIVSPIMVIIVALTAISSLPFHLTAQAYLFECALCNHDCRKHSGTVRDRVDFYHDLYPLDEVAHFWNPLSQSRCTLYSA